MRVEVIESPGAFRALADEWEALAARSPTGDVFATHAWIDAWWSAFARPDESLAIHAVRGRDGRLVALAPFLRSPLRLELSDRVASIPFAGRAAESVLSIARRPWARLAGARRLAGAFNHYAGRGALLVDPAAPEALGALLRGLVGERGAWDLAELPWIPEDSPLFAELRERCPTDLHAHGVRVCSSPYLPLTGTSFSAYYAARFSPKTKGRDRQALRRAKSRAGFSLEVVRGELGRDTVRALIEEVMAVERAGWKGEEGSAIGQDPRARAFFHDVAGRFAARRSLVLVLLRLEGRLVAFVLGFVHRGWFFYLKTSYDPDFEVLRPGRIVTLRAVEEAFSLGLERFDFLGADDDYKLRFTDLARPHANVFLYHEGVRSRIHRTLKRSAVPLAKALLGRTDGYPVQVDR